MQQQKIFRKETTHFINKYIYIIKIEKKFSDLL